MVGDEGKGCEEALEMRGKKVGWLGDGWNNYAAFPELLHIFGPFARA